MYIHKVFISFKQWNHMWASCLLNDDDEVEEEGERGEEGQEEGMKEEEEVE